MCLDNKLNFSFLRVPLTKLVCACSLQEPVEVVVVVHMGVFFLGLTLLYVDVIIRLAMWDLVVAEYCLFELGSFWEGLDEADNVGKFVCDDVVDVVCCEYSVSCVLICRGINGVQNVLCSLLMFDCSD